MYGIAQNFGVGGGGELADLVDLPVIAKFYHPNASFASPTKNEPLQVFVLYGILI